ncbi:Uncharacterised protein [uncultured Clostridium sp.]|uniref:hypothetical protein n=1 Tax=uncultured Clostridium sp. TaxID=59620 RepID=UPI0008233A5C|nr:hypothetical protein [uncultured Clostridium sp.]SCJ10417.1 Uncharacterised protein [uncultured Clostridium sp.]
MRLKFNKTLVGWSIIDDHSKIVAKIKNKELLGSAKNIIDKDGNIVFTTDIINLPSKNKDWNCAGSKKYIIYQKENEIATATFSYAKNPERTTLQKFALRPPQIDIMEVETPYGLLHIKRQKDNSILIYKDEKKLGMVTSFFSFKAKYLECIEEYDPTFLASLYMLIDYMMHEDDLIIV